MNEFDKSTVAANFDKVWKTMDEEYWKRDIIDDKIRIVVKDAESTYQTKERSDTFELHVKGKFCKYEDNFEGHDS